LGTGIPPATTSYSDALLVQRYKGGKPRPDSYPYHRCCSAPRLRTL